MEEWIARYSENHRHPVNRFRHTIGIPLIALSLPLGALAPFVQGLRPVPTGTFLAGCAPRIVPALSPDR